MTGTIALAEICRAAVVRARRAHEDAEIILNDRDEVVASWDRAQVYRLLRHLLAGALAQNAPGAPILVSVVDWRDDALITVVNRRRRATGLLGAREPETALSGFLPTVVEIVQAQGGWLETSRRNGRTAFCVWLPKRGLSVAGSGAALSQA